MTDAALVGRILRGYRLDAAGPAGVRRLYGSASGARVGYLITAPDGAGVVVRAFRGDEPLPVYLRGCGTALVTDWLYGRAATLEFLASRGFPAPRTVPTRTGEPVGVAGIWLTWATTDVAGLPLAPGSGGPGMLGLLGEALARLHALGAPDGAAGTSPGYPEATIEASLRRLAAVETLLPADWRPMHAEFRQALLALRQAALPMTVVHGGAWPANVIRTGPAEVTLIGWENAGPGLAVTDLGQSLLECHLDPDRPAAWHIQPDAARIGALVTGYSRLRRLDDAERKCLLPAIRFASAVMVARHFEQALTDGVRGAGMDARLGRLRNRLEVSRAVAELALHHLDDPPSRYAEPGSSVEGDTGA